MKKIVLILAIILFASFAWAADNDRTINVTGYGEVEVAPDTGNISLGFRTVSADLAKAKADMTAKMDATIDALKPFGIEAKDIQSTQLYIYPNYATTDGVTTLQGYDVSRSITVVFKDLSNTDAILDAAIKAGANSFNGLNFTFSGADQLKNDALAKAIENAIAQADFLAQSFSVKRGNLISVSTMSQNFAPRNAEMYAMKADSAGGQGYQPGTVKVSAQINAVFGIN